MGQTNEDEVLEIDLLDLLFALKRKVHIVAASSLLACCLACAFVQFLAEPVYESMSSLLVLTKETTLSSLADLQMGTQLTNDYRVLTSSRPVLESVIETLDLDTDYEEFGEKITIDNPTDTRILEITVEDSDPVMAKTIVNELARTASEFIGDKMEVIPPKIIEVGQIPVERTSPSMPLFALIGFLIGFVLSAGTVTAMAIMDNTIKSAEDIEKYLGLSTLASVPDRKDYIGGKKKSSKKARGKKKSPARPKGKKESK